MPTKVKIRLIDNSELRMKIDEAYEKVSQVDLAKWSLLMAKHIFNIAHIDYKLIDAIVDGFMVNELWQTGKARMYDVRQAGFKIHKVARECESEIKRTSFRVAGQEIGRAHV